MATPKKILLSLFCAITALLNIRKTGTKFAAVLLVCSLAAQQVPSQASEGTLRLTPAQPAAEGSTMIVAPGNGLQNYRIFLIDVQAFANGGNLNIDIHVSRNSATDGSFDLFPSDVTIPVTGRPAGTLSGRYDIRKGSTTQLTYHFNKGQVFAFCLDGNWFSPKGARGLVRFQASVE